MKKPLIVITVISALIFSACAKMDSDLLMNNNSSGNMTAFKNSDNWVSTSAWANYSKPAGRFVVVGSRVDPQYTGNTEVLYFTLNRADVLKKDTVKQFYSEWHQVIGGNVMGDACTIDSTAANWVKISTIDTLGYRISGTFGVKLLPKQTNTTQKSTLIFKNGAFNLKYKLVYD